jgi:abortive infection bacteriophage resistance protein
MIKPKPALTPKDLITILKSRNLTIENEQEAEFFLQTISYNRFSSYRFPFLKNQTQDKEIYKENTKFTDITQLINTDFSLKTNIFNIARHIELALRSQFVTNLGKDPYFHLDINNYNINANTPETINQNNQTVNRLIKTFQNPQIITSFNTYHNNKNNNTSQPILSAIEHLSFEQLIKFYKYINLPNEKTSIIKFFSNFPTYSIFIKDKHFINLISDIKSIRNIIAHHDKIITRYEFKDISNGTLQFLKINNNNSYTTEISSAINSIITNYRNKDTTFLPYYLMLKYFTILLTQHNNLHYIKDSFNNITNIFNNNFDYLISKKFKNQTKPNDITIIKSILTQI